MDSYSTCIFRVQLLNATLDAYTGCNHNIKGKSLKKGGFPIGEHIFDKCIGDFQNDETKQHAYK